MIIRNFLSERHGFIVAKQVTKNKKAELIGNYKRLIEKSVILSLIITIALFHLFPREKREKNNSDSLSLSLEVIDIPVTVQEEPPPPPSPVQEVITNYTVIIKKEKKDVHKLREEIEDVTLDLDLKPDDNLLASSQIDAITYAELNRNRVRFDKGASLNISSSLRNTGNHDAGGLNFDLATNSTGKRFVDNVVALEPPPLATTPKRKSAEIKKVDNGLIKISENQFLLKESESTIGTDEYRLWNKINAALDRLDKNRYGNLPGNVRRTKKGLTASFSYNDGIIHDIFWSKGGKVIIRVTGHRPQQLVTELRKAFDALIRLTL